MTIRRKNILTELRVCSNCGESKHRSEFNKNKTCTDGLNSHCRICQAERRRRYKERLKIKFLTLKEKTCHKCKKIKPISQFWLARHICKECERPSNSRYLKSRLRRKKQLFVAMAGGACQRCGYKEFLPSLEFHHIDPQEKEYPPTRLVAVSKDKALQELDKCILLCANCHEAFECGYWDAEFIKRNGLGYTIKEVTN